MPAPAAAIIQRAWLSNGIAAVADRLNCFPVFDMIRNDNLYHAELTTFIEAGDDFRVWVYKLLVRCGVPEALRLSSDPDLRVCWVIVVYSAHFHGDAGLVDAASELVTSLLEFLDEEYGTMRTTMSTEIKDFLNKYMEWKASNFTEFMGNLRVELIEKMYNARRRTHVLGVESEFRNLHAMYCLMDNSLTGFTSTNVYRAIQLATETKCWVPAVSKAKIMHELILNKNHNVPFCDSLPELSSKHTVNGRIVDSIALRDDMMSTLIGFVDEAVVLDEVAEAFHRTKTYDTVLFANEIFPVFMAIAIDTSLGQQVRSEWESGKESRPLETLVLVFRMIRNLLDNTVIDVGRVSMAGDIHLGSLTRQTWAMMQVSETKRSIEWIHSSIQKYSRAAIAALASSNPYALIEFFDNSFLELVLEKGTTDFLDEHRLPEFLRFDRDRLVLVRLDLSMHSFKPKDFMELVNAEKWMGPRACPPSLIQTSKQFRAMLRLNRFCHGQLINSLVVRHANDLGC